MKWPDVARQHGTQQGVSAPGGLVRSVLLAGTSQHRNRTDADGSIVYTVPDTSMYRQALAALRSAREEGRAFRAFKKNAPNDWEDLGLHRVVEVRSGRGVVEFVLTPAP